MRIKKIPDENLWLNIECLTFLKRILTFDLRELSTWVSFKFNQSFFYSFIWKMISSFIYIIIDNSLFALKFEEQTHTSTTHTHTLPVSSVSFKEKKRGKLSNCVRSIDLLFLRNMMVIEFFVYLHGSTWAYAALCRITIFD